MMFVSGLMMAIAGFNGNGNDTKTLPSVIAFFGFAFSLWAFYRIGYVKSHYDNQKNREEKQLEKKVLIMQVFEAVLYLLITALGVFFFVNEGFTNKVLDLMCGCFTILNGIFGCIYVYKNREEKNFSWKFRIALTAIEFGMGLYFIFASNSINSVGYAIMGSLTTIAGLIEITHAITQENIENTLKDGKNIIKVLKDEKDDE